MQSKQIKELSLSYLFVIGRINGICRAKGLCYIEGYLRRDALKLGVARYHKRFALMQGVDLIYTKYILIKILKI